MYGEYSTRRKGSQESAFDRWNARYRPSSSSRTVSGDEQDVSVKTPFMSLKESSCGGSQEGYGYSFRTGEPIEAYRGPWPWSYGCGFHAWVKGLEQWCSQTPTPYHTPSHHLLPSSLSSSLSVSSSEGVSSFSSRSETQEDTTTWGLGMETPQGWIRLGALQSFQDVYETQRNGGLFTVLREGYEERSVLHPLTTAHLPSSLSSFQDSFLSLRPPSQRLTPSSFHTDQALLKTASSLDRALLSQGAPEKPYQNLTNLTALTVQKDQGDLTDQRVLTDQGEGVDGLECEEVRCFRNEQIYLRGLRIYDLKGSSRFPVTFLPSHSSSCVGDRSQREIVRYQGCLGWTGFGWYDGRSLVRMTASQRFHQRLRMQGYVCGKGGQVSGLYKKVTRKGRPFHYQTLQGARRVSPFLGQSFFERDLKTPWSKETCLREGGGMYVKEGYGTSEAWQLSVRAGVRMHKMMRLGVKQMQGYAQRYKAHARVTVGVRQTVYALTPRQALQPELGFYLEPYAPYALPNLSSSKERMNTSKALNSVGEGGEQGVFDEGMYVKMWQGRTQREVALRTCVAQMWTPGLKRGVLGGQLTVGAWSSRGPWGLARVHAPLAFEIPLQPNGFLSMDQTQSLYPFHFKPFLSKENSPSENTSPSSLTHKKTGFSYYQRYQP